MEKIVKYYFILIAGLTCAVSAIAQEQAANAGDKAANDKANAALATFAGDNKLTVAEFARRQPALLSWAGLGAGSAEIQTAVEDIVFESVLAKEAEASGVAQNPEVQNQITRILKNAYLKQHVPMDEIEVEDMEIERYYKKNMEKFKKPAVAKFSQVVLATEKQAKEVSAGNWSSEAQKSLDTISAKRKGALGQASVSTMMPELRAVAEKLEVGSVSEPVKTVFGYHVLKLDKPSDVTYLSIEDVRKEIFDELMKQKKRDRLKSVQKKLWDKYDVSIESDEIDKLVKENAAQNTNVDRSSFSRSRQPQSKATELQAIVELVDLGMIAPVKTRESVLIGNTSDHPIEISKVSSSCPCMQVDVADKVLKPGQVTKVNFEYNPDTLKDGGNVERMITIESNDSIENKKYIRIRAWVDRGTDIGKK